MVVGKSRIFHGFARTYKVNITYVGGFSLKQTKKLTRKHWEYLAKMGISREVVDTLRFVEDNKVYGYIFSQNGKKVIAIKGKLVEYYGW